MDDIATYVLAILGGGGLWQLMLWLLNRNKDKAEQAQIVVNTKETAVNTELLAAEAGKVQVETKGAEVVYYQNAVDKLVTQVNRLEEQVAGLKTSLDVAQEKYERRVGTLHEQLDRLATELGRANTQLETANKTIGELRQEVKDGNVVIAELRKEITQLLVKQAEKKEG